MQMHSTCSAWPWMETSTSSCTACGTGTRSTGSAECRPSSRPTCAAFATRRSGTRRLCACCPANQQWATSERGMRALRYLYELGQPMLLGSDTPSAPTYGNQPGYDTFKEMKLMAQAGIPLADIFAAAT